MKRIVTEHVYPPIPDRSCDWQATFADDEPNDAGQMLVGRGPTEAAAAADLEAQAEELCSCGHGWCPMHGTDHLPPETEFLCDELRVMNLTRNGGIRVIKKKLSSD